jgi:hypothetical protein
LQKTLARTDFEPSVSAKTIARIERNQVRPRGKTLAVLAMRLRVKADDIALF